MHRVAWQSDLVSTSINEFMINLVEAVLIVVAVLWVAMGWRMAVIIGVCGLLFTVIGTFLFMAIWDIDLQRTSLGALIIAMGMMVDNAIVVADGAYPGGHRSRHPAVHATAGGYYCGGDGVLPYLCLVKSNR
jgi:multidrug efflux pump subunit AcrB